MCVHLYICLGVDAHVYVCICRREPEDNLESPPSDTIRFSYDIGPFTYLELAKQSRLAVQ